ncbi:MAG: hypothetical protein KA984_04835 [Candidatus Cloacimonetes bacterium]|nr:hypothetical protein [Candidatus Cloacimonadota bacterium]
MTGYTGLKGFSLCVGGGLETAITFAFCVGGGLETANTAPNFYHHKILTIFRSFIISIIADA